MPSDAQDRRDVRRGVEWKHAGEQMGCDFCNNAAVGWTRLRFKDHTLGGIRAVQVFSACSTHIQMGEPVYPGPWHGQTGGDG